jgi:undecaprenyl-diphosphatase
MSTIAGGQLARMSRTAALEFSFFLSIPTMVVATSYDLLKSLLPGKAGSIAASSIDAHGWVVLAIGFTVSFVVAFFSVRWFMGWVDRRGLLHFAGYRILLGIIVLVATTSP